jgi:hypothetical protein
MQHLQFIDRVNAHICKGQSLEPICLHRFLDFLFVIASDRSKNRVGSNFLDYACSEVLVRLRLGLLVDLLLPVHQAQPWLLLFGQNAILAHSLWAFHRREQSKVIWCQRLKYARPILRDLVLERFVDRQIHRVFERGIEEICNGRAGLRYFCQTLVPGRRSSAQLVLCLWSFMQSVQFWRL